METLQWPGQPENTGTCEFCGHPLKGPPRQTQEWQPGSAQTPPARIPFNEPSAFSSFDGHFDIKPSQTPNPTVVQRSLFSGGEGLNTGGISQEPSSRQPQGSRIRSVTSRPAPPFSGSTGFNDPGSPFDREPWDTPRPNVEYITPSIGGDSLGAVTGLSPLYQQNHQEHRLEEQLQRQEDYDAPRCGNCGRRPSRYYAR
jgi:hypothetical protein